MTIRTIATSTVRNFILATGMTGSTFYDISINGVVWPIGQPLTSLQAIEDQINSIIQNTVGLKYSCELTAGVNFAIYYAGTDIVINYIRTYTGVGYNTYVPVVVSQTYLRDYLNESMATQRETVTRAVPAMQPRLNYGTCPCTCDFTELVFAGSTAYETDYTSYLFRKVLSTDSTDVKLYKGTTSHNITTAIATLYDYGVLPDSSYFGFVIDWKKVFDLYGYGEYQLKGTEVRLGVSYVYESHLFELCAFNATRAKGTVKVECYQNGYIESEDFDLTGFNWYQAIRLQGKFSKGVPKLTQENYVNSGRLVSQIQDSIQDEWLLELHPVTAQVANMIVYNFTMGNEVLVSDYNVAPEVYDAVSVIPTEVIEYKTFSKNTNVRTTLKLNSRLQNIIKRNFK